ncbi:MAG: tetratricopeptide repeat protein [Bryobacteraceae bacterium]
MRWLVAMVLGASVLVAAQPASFDEEFHHGLLALENNRLAEAKQSLQQASRLQPENPKVWMALAQAYLRSQQPGPANAAAKRAEVLAGNQPVIQRALALFYSETGDFAKAAELARHDESFTFELGQGLLRRGDFAGALSFFDTARKRFPNSAQIALAYGVAAYGQRRFGDSIDAFLRVIRIDPSVEQPYVFLSRLLDQAGDRLGEITAAYAAWEKAAPRNCLPVCLHAKALSAAGGDAAVIEAELRRSIQLNDAYWESHFELGVLLAKDRRWEDAAAELKRGIELNPKHAAAHFQLARVYEKLGKPELAQAERAEHERLTAAETNAERTPGTGSDSAR